MDSVFLNGEYLPRSEAQVSADDRGFCFGDGVYEFTPVYGGRFLRLEPRIARLRRGLAELRIDYDASSVQAIYQELLERNGLSDAHTASIYIQVTRGVAKRTHAFPPVGTPPTVYAYTGPLERMDYSTWEAGGKAITFPDFRWGRVDLKTLQLLPNVLGQEAAQSAGVSEVVLVKDGIALEGARSNLFLVLDGVIRTHPTSNQILPGISRQLILELARERGYEVEEVPAPVHRLKEASEVFLTGSSSEVLPLVEIDGARIGDGTAGPATRDLYEAFVEHIEEECDVSLASGG